MAPVRTDLLPSLAGASFYGGLRPPDPPTPSLAGPRAPLRPGGRSLALALSARRRTLPGRPSEPRLTISSGLQKLPHQAVCLVLPTQRLDPSVLRAAFLGVPGQR